MSTLTVQIPDTDLAKLRACADADKVSVEHEALLAFRQFFQTREQANIFQTELPARGVTLLTDEQIRQYKNEGRE